MKILDETYLWMAGHDPTIDSITKSLTDEGFGPCWQQCDGNCGDIGDGVILMDACEVELDQGGDVEDAREAKKECRQHVLLLVTPADAAVIREMALADTSGRDKGQHQPRGE